MKPYRYYLFDFDGTTFDSIRSSEYVFYEAYKSIGIEINKEDILGFTREPIPDSYNRLNAPKEKWDAFAAEILRLVNSDKSVELTDIFPDTYDTLLDLKMSEANLAIVTSNNVKHVKDILKKFDMLDMFFDVLIGNEEAPVPKPDPMPILKAIEAFKYKGDKSDIVYVGDSLNDVIAAQRAGVDAVLIDRDNEYPDSIDYFKIKSLKDLL